MSQEQETKPVPRTMGVLLVHGIGVQRRGHTLLQNGNAILECLNGLLGFGGTSARLGDTSLCEKDADTQPHATIHFETTHGRSPLTWQLAESHWAEEFPPPSYWDFLMWAFRTLPLIVLFHLVPKVRSTFELFQIGFGRGDRKERDERAKVFLETVLKLSLDGGFPLKAFMEKGLNVMLRGFVTLLLMPLIVVAGFLVQVMLLLVALVAWLPFDFAKALARTVQVGVSATLGDSYLFTSNPFVEAIVVSKVRRDIEDLAKRCDQVVVVAHSQGAAVAHQAIEQMNTDKTMPAGLELFVTYGSGLQKLMDLRIDPAKAKTAQHLGWMCQMLSLAMAAGVLMVWSKPQPATLILTGVALLTIWLVMAILLYQIVIRFDVRASAPPLDWENFYASHDPVPNGETEFAAGTIDGKFTYTQHEVWNFRSTVQDHTTYWLNLDGFVSRLIARIMVKSGIPMHPTTAGLLESAKNRRRWRVGLLSACRKSTLILAACVVFWPTDAVQEIGSELAAKTAGARSSISSAVAPLANSIDLGKDYAGLADGLRKLDGKLLVGAAFVLALIFVLYSIARVGWNFMDRRDISDFYKRQGFHISWFGCVLFVIAWLTVLLLPVTFSLGLPTSHPNWLPAYLASAVVLYGILTYGSIGKAPE